jgi:ABC-2 type transport system ATP-binding protein
VSAVSTMVRVENLSKGDSKRTRVDSVSFDVPRGEVVGLLGPNGAGKTTALKMLVGLMRPTGGTAELLGCQVGSSGFPTVLRHVGTLIESPAIYSQLTVRQNLIMSCRVLAVEDPERRVADLLDLVDISDRADDRAATLSLGMKQRLGIALALVATPSLVLLDEPANGLDPAGIVEIRHLLRQLPALGTTVLVSSHQLNELQQACDRLIVMAAGRVVANGTTTEILSGFSGNRFLIRLDPVDVASAQQCLASAGLQGDWEQSTAAIAVTLHDDLTGRDLNRMLSAQNIHAIEIHRETVTLEEAFLTMTSGTTKSENIGGRHDAR